MIQKGFISPIILIVVLVTVAIGGYALWKYVNIPPASSLQATVCTQDAKQCPDGSHISRTGPHCEFAACPNEKLALQSAIPADWKTYRNEQLRIELHYPNDITIVIEKTPDGLTSPTGPRFSIHLSKESKHLYIRAQETRNTDELFQEYKIKKMEERMLAGKRAIEVQECGMQGCYSSLIFIQGGHRFTISQFKEENMHISSDSSFEEVLNTLKFY